MAGPRRLETSDVIKKLRVPEGDNKRDIARLQAALKRLNLPIAPRDFCRGDLGESTKAAIKAFQERAGLSPQGDITPETVDRLKRDLQHAFVAEDKTRTKRLHEMLARTGAQLAPDELKSRAFGPSTVEALKRYQAAAGLLQDGRVTEDLVNRLREDALKARLSTKTQVGQVQRTLLRALQVAKLGDVRVDAGELRGRELGPTTQAAVKRLQEKYKLPATGKLDAVTFDRLTSVAASIPQPSRRLKPKAAAELKRVKRAARLNMTGGQVPDVQQALAFLGYQVDEKEYAAGVFGKTTRAAVVDFQRSRSLPVNGHVEGETLASLNREVARANPQAVATAQVYRLRGSVRDELWAGMSGIRVQVWERQIDGPGALLAERPTRANGFFDIPYDPPKSRATGQVQQPFNLRVAALDANGQEIGSKLLYNPTVIDWVNFTLGDQPYRGTSQFAGHATVLAKTAGVGSIPALRETAQDPQISRAAQAAGLSADDVMRLVLAHLVAAQLQESRLSPEACYAYIGQNLPPVLPGNLIGSTEDWTLIDQLVDLSVNGLVFMDDDLQKLGFENAITENLVPIAFGRQKDAILAALKQLKQTFALEKPILTGNGSLKALLDASDVPATSHEAVAAAFLQHKSLAPSFWSDLQARPGDFGGAAAVRDFETTVDVGHMAKNFTPMVTLLKQKIKDNAVPNIKSAHDLAKLTTQEWEALINENGEQVPPNTDGATPADRVKTYAVILASRSERLFPAVALAATVGRSANNPLPHVAGVQKLLDDHPELDLRVANLDAFVVQNNVNLDAATLTEARVMQRVHRIAPTAAAGQTLLDNKIHNSAQIVTMGKQRFADAMTATNLVDRRTALTVFGLAEFQYAQVLGRISDYRFELHRANPRAIVSHTYKMSDLPPVLARIPDLETLFGSADFCDCAHCRSVYGPPAYLADVLRFLESHPAEVAGKTVKDILFERRPDIGNIKLNCENTETPLPYIDLVCEVLENAVAAPNPTPDFAFQTTRTAAELRAFPEHVRQDAYDLLKDADFPLDVAFNLWQEEARVFLDHLGVARWELMETFQARPAGVQPSPADVSIAGEYWGMSTHETAIVTTQENTAPRQTVYWGFDASGTDIVVADFMRRSRLEYGQLLDLLSAHWVNPESPNKMVIERPNATCSTEEQKLTKLTPDRLDRMGRFLRLWRRTGWPMWELDLLVRAVPVGNDRIDKDTLVRLQQFKQLQARLRLGTQAALVLFEDINTEVRTRPDDPSRQIQPLYADIFLNPAVVSPPDPVFALPLAAGLQLSGRKGALLAAFALVERDLALLLARILSDDLTLGNLSRIGRYAMLAQGLRLRIEDLLRLEALSGVPDIFASPKVLLDFLELVDWVMKSGFAVDELGYLLAFEPDSPYGLREEVITEYVEALREALRGNEASSSDGTITSEVAGVFELAPEQAHPLLTGLQLAGPTLLAHLSDPRLVARDANGDYVTPVTPVNYPNIYNAYRLLHKAALLVNRLKVATTDLEWLLANAATFNLLDLGALPVTGAPVAPLFPAWLALYQWLYFEGQHPKPEGVSLAGVFDLAGNAAIPVATIHAAIAGLTQWKAQDLDDLASGLGLQHVDGGGNAILDYAKVDTYVRLWKCFTMVKRIGAGAGVLLAWADRDDDTNSAQAATAHGIRQAAKSKYDYAVWLEKVTPLQDVVREKKRAALTTHLVEASLRTGAVTWQDPNDLLAYFLIDVEMSACQLTSRLKQAISSTQMFVQRCLLGLEQPLVEVSRGQQQETVSDNSWNQWKWMKSYRLWEANRKVFLYPENWLEPELRDDKSPFFKELEGEILQSDMTDENVREAFLHYVQKVHEVARLDIAGAYYEIDDTDPSDNLPPDINVLHVIGRTRSHPAVYYYRKFDLNYGEWSAWERIDVDIQGDHPVPVVYNRRLYIFWLDILEKPQKVKKQPPAQPSDRTNVPEAPNQLEIQLAWTARKDAGWTAKRVSKQKLIHPWQRPLHSYNLKPRYKARENLVWLDLYISQSQQFNNTKFWDAYANKPAFVTAFRFSETARPWHSSSFVFDGDVVDVKMKALSGMYHVLDATGVPSDDLVETTSYQYVRDSFGDQGSAINRLTGGYEIAPQLALPDGMHYHNTRLANNKRSLNANRANVLENGNTRTLLNGAKSPFEIVFSQHRIDFDTAESGQAPFFYQDNQRAFFIRPGWQEVILGYNQTLQTRNYEFYPLYHPYTALFMRELARSGVDGLLNRRIQLSPQAFYPGNNFDFNDYAPTSICTPNPTAKKDTVDFERYGAYSLYNWEMFFHAPLMIACKLSANQRFEEALRWFHYIFDPTNTESPDVPQRYWITRPFYEQNDDAYRQQRIDVLLNNIEQHQDELRAWKNHPFKPHLVARYRPVAYQKAVVRTYIDNLIAWGDQLFRRDTIESINEATTLYVLAYELLGRRPVKVPEVGHTELSYRELTSDGALDPFGNKRVEILMENFTGTPVRVVRTEPGAEPLPRLDVFYFGIPNNDRQLDYWNKVEDRLFKIRHCMNIQGVVRRLPLFEPPIDPALLVKAAAAGVDVGSLLDEFTATTSPYRFQRLAQKAVELCNEVRALGDKLLSALEKFDAEGMALLRSTQEIRLQQAVREVRKHQIKEANDTWAGLEQTRKLAEQKRDFYEGRDLMNPWEITALSLGGLSAGAGTTIALGYILTGGLALIPRINAGASGFGGSPHATVEPVSGDRLAKASEAGVQTLNAIATALDKFSSLAATMGSYRQRKDDWNFQGRQAATEIEQIDKQIAAAQIRLAITEKELENQELQIEQSQAANEYMRTKYTSQQLYDWHVRQAAALYFQSYQLAYDMAKRAEKSFQHEIGDPAATFVQFGYWDSLKKGLMSGERLGNDIRRMEAAYLEQNRRDLEITKHVSLAQFLPLSLLALKEGGACTVVLPEWLFDMDFPGHYRRRSKSVNLSIPCVVGPYTSINCTLSLTNHGIRMNESVAGGYGNPLVAGDSRFFKSQVPVTVIATSHGQNDSGMFELSFNDDRFLPFEGAGVVSEWRLELPRENNQFDLSSISDVVLHLRYTAVPSSSAALVQAAKDNVNAALPASGLRLLALNHDFASAWHRFLRPGGGAEQTLSFMLGREHLPFYARGKSNINLTKVDLIVESPDAGNFDVRLKVPGAGPATNETMTPDPAFGGRQHAARSGFAGNQALLGNWEIQVRKAGAPDFKSLGPDDIRNAYIVLGFQTS